MPPHLGDDDDDGGYGGRWYRLSDYLRPLVCLSGWTPTASAPGWAIAKVRNRPSWRMRDNHRSYRLAGGHAVVPARV